MAYIGQVNIGGTTYPVGSMLYGVCDTAIGTAAKTVTMSNFDTLASGVTVHIKFTNGNTAASPTLKIGSTDAKSITNPNGETNCVAGAILSLTYDGTNWVINDGKNTATTFDTLTQTEVNTGTGTTGKLVTAKVIKDTVTNAINTIDGSISGTASAGKTLTAFSQTNGVVNATFGNISITKSQVSDLGTIGAAAAKGVDSSIAENSSSTNLPTSDAVATFVQAQTAGLTGAMHFIGTTSTALTDGATTSTLVEKTSGSLSKTTGFVAGDVVISGDKEFVWIGSAWELLGDEGSYALKSNTASVIPDVTFTTNTKPTLTITSTAVSKLKTAGSFPEMNLYTTAVPNVTNAGSSSSYTVSGATLTLTPSVAPTMGEVLPVISDVVMTGGAMPTFDSVSVGSASGWNAGTQASLTKSAAINVVVP